MAYLEPNIQMLALSQDSWAVTNHCDDRQSSGKQGPEAIVGTTGISLGKIIVEHSMKDVLPFQILILA